MLVPVGLLARAIVELIAALVSGISRSGAGTGRRRGKPAGPSAGIIVAVLGAGVVVLVGTCGGAWALISYSNRNRQAAWQGGPGFNGPQPADPRLGPPVREKAPTLNPTDREKPPKPNPYEQAEPLPNAPFASDPALAVTGANVFLSDMSEYGWKPGPDNWSFGKNGSVGNGFHPDARIRVNGVNYPKGLGMHPPARTFTRVCYALGKRAKSLQGAVGIAEDEPITPGPTRFVVLGDGKLRWRSDSIRAQKVKQDFQVDVSDIEVLELRTYVEQGSNNGAHAAWLDPFVMTK
jgi:hypothetical protein